jgi:hypothetical protein
MLRSALAGAMDALAERRQERDPEIAAGTPGFYLDFEIAPGFEDASVSLEDRREFIELVAVRQATDESPAQATVFVPDSADDHFFKKVQAYQSEQTSTGRPKNEPTIARIQDIGLSDLRSLFTDAPALFPSAGERIWWEIWIRQGRIDTFDTVARRLQILVQQQQLVFPEREVRLVFGDENTIARLFVNSDAIAEIRRAKDTPSPFLEWSNVEQAAWAMDLVDRLSGPESTNVAVCILDTGVTRAHPLLAPALDTADAHLYDPGWPSGDRRGHGTNMAGTVLYGDLLPLLAGNGTVRLTHVLESVKILPDVGDNEPRLYGAITRESVARVEVQNPDRRRAFCMAVTSNFENDRGRPSSWSAAIDQLAFGDGTTPRLLLVSAGNIPTGVMSRADYPARNETEPIENPAQAWNVITVGAYTEKAILTDPTYDGWEPIAPVGDLSPTSRTSVMWDRQWPNKPDIVLEGGNWADLGDQCDCPDDLGVLTTYHDPTTRHFYIFGDTSAATAFAGNLAGKIIASAPDQWPETVRGLIVHSAEWTTAMRARFGANPSVNQKRLILRKYGYGVPSYERALFSSLNDLTLIAEDTLRPLWRDENDGKVKSHMNLYQLPWPRTELEQLAETEVELRVTLSYFVEPNPGERGWFRRHRYPSHGLRFALKRSLESVDAFRQRINAAVKAEEGIGTIDAGPDNWFLGRIRDAGSVHSDYWRGTAIDLAQRSALGVYPVVTVRTTTH